jgi:hypothetical protein
MRERSLVLPPRHWGIAHSSLQKRHQGRSARVRRQTVFDNLAPLAEHSADILVPPHRQTPAQRGFFRSHLLVICAAKPRYTAAAAREHRRVLEPRLPTPAQVSHPRCTRHERCSLRCASAASSWTAWKVRCARCSFANGRPPLKWPPAIIMIKWQPPGANRSIVLIGPGLNVLPATPVFSTSCWFVYYCFESR